MPDAKYCYLEEENDKMEKMELDNLYETCKEV